MPLSSLLVKTPCRSGSPQGVRGGTYFLAPADVVFAGAAGACATNDMVVRAATAVKTIDTLTAFNASLLTCPPGSRSLQNAPAESTSWSFGEVTRLDDGDLGKVDVTLESGLNIGRRQGVDPLFELPVPRNRPLDEGELSQPPGQLGVLSSADLSRLQQAFLRGLHFVRSKALLQSAVDFFLDSRFEPGDVLWRIDRLHHEEAALVERARLELRRDAVAEALLLANPGGKARIQESSTQHVRAQDECRVVWIVVAKAEILSGDEEGVRLIGSLD